MKSCGLAPFGSDSDNVLPAKWTTGRAQAQWAGNYDHCRMKRLGSVVQKFRTARSTTGYRLQAGLAAGIRGADWRDDAHLDELVDQWFSEKTVRLPRRRSA